MANPTPVAFFNEAARVAVLRVLNADALAVIDTFSPAIRAEYMASLSERADEALNAALDALPPRSKAFLALAEMSDEELVERVALAIRYGQPHDGSDCDDATVMDARRILTALGLSVEQETTE